MEIKDLIESIRPEADETIRNRCRNETFARTIVILCLNSQEKINKGILYPIITAKELSKLMRFSIQRGRYILQELVDLEMLIQLKIRRNSQYAFVFEDNKIKLFQYMNISLKTIKINLPEIETKDL